MSDITEPMKHEWSQNLQRRVMRLLLVHDRPLFQQKFCTLYTESSLPLPPILQQYDRYLRLLNLSDELLNDIMPRIRRQLSLHTDHERLCETAPTRGSIDWPRTARRGSRESPGQPSLRFDTHLRQHSTATPENTLTVAILLAYQAELRGLQHEGLGDEGLTDQELQILTGAAERIERELAAPYARALLGEAQRCDLARLVDQVEARLRPGANPYRDLIDWWRRVKRLQIGRDTDKKALTLASVREDEKMEAWLYELWVTLEFIHFLDQEHKLVVDETHPATIEVAEERGTVRFLFRWGAENRCFCFTYNRQRKESSGEAAIWQNAPAARPDYTIEREQTEQIVVTATDETTGTRKEIWREPPVLLDAKYYLGKSDAERTHGPVKKLLGDMALLNIYQVLLFFPLLSGPGVTATHSRVVHPRKHYHSTGRQQECQIHQHQLRPDMNVVQVQQKLREVLDHVITHLPQRPAPACEGMLLDPDTLNASAHALSEFNAICPKRHIGQNVFDLVHTERHCLKDPRLCHVIDQRGHIEPPHIVRVTTRDALTQQITNLRTQGAQELVRLEQQERSQSEAEEARERIFRNIGRVIEQYVALRGNTRTIEEHYKRWVFQGYWKEGTRSLADKACDMLISGEYVWNEYVEINLNDWAAPAIQYCRALELEVRRRLYLPRQADFRFRRNTRWTLGSLGYLYEHRHARSGDDVHNWQIVTDIVSSAGCTLIEFEAILDRFANERIVEHRNHLAHGEPILRATAEIIRNAIIGDRGQPGILCRLVERLDPV